MSHPVEGLLRRAVDEPAALSDAEREHIRGCEQCRGELAAARADRDVVAALLGGDGTPNPERLPDAVQASNGTVLDVRSPDVPSLDLERAWRQVVDHVHDVDAGVAAPPPRRERRWSRLRRPVVAVTAAAVLAVGSTAAAAAGDWLQIFEPERVAAIDLQANDLSALPDLSEYGSLKLPEDEPQEVPDEATAEARTGIDVPAIGDLPTGIGGDPQYAVVPENTAEFTFSAAKARAAAERRGQALPPMPAGVDGSTLRVDAGPGVAMLWTAGSGVPELGIVRMTAPTASTQGVSLPTLRDYLLAQPGIPASVAGQLREMFDDGTVLPVPVPSEYASTSTTTVDGVTATVVKLRDQSGAGLVWISGGLLNVVFGLLTVEDLEGVARDVS